MSILVVIVENHWTGKENLSHGDWWDLGRLIALGLVMWLSQVVSLDFQLFKSEAFPMAREELLFWLRSYDGKRPIISY